MQDRLLTDVQEKAVALKREVAKRIVGLDDAVEAMLICLFGVSNYTENFHLLLEAIPGTGKTSFAKAVAAATKMSMGRISFGPDILPSDIVGLEERQETAEGIRVKLTVPGPVFNNIIILDELNRASTKAKASILEALEEGTFTTVLGGRHILPSPFMAIATQNSVEAEGTFDLGRAEQDRFLMKVVMDYPTEDEEVDIVRMNIDPQAKQEEICPVMSADDVLGVRSAIARHVHVQPALYTLGRRMASLTRPEQTSLKNVKEMVSLRGGASPRAGIHLVDAARVYAVLHGNYYVTPADLTKMALPVFRHRIVLQYGTDKERKEEVLTDLIQQVCNTALGPSVR